MFLCLCIPKMTQNFSRNMGICNVFMQVSTREIYLICILLLALSWWYETTLLRPVQQVNTTLWRRIKGHIRYWLFITGICGRVYAGKISVDANSSTIIHYLSLKMCHWLDICQSRHWVRLSYWCLSKLLRPTDTHAAVNWVIIRSNNELSSDKNWSLTLTQMNPN